MDREQLNLFGLEEAAAIREQPQLYAVEKENSLRNNITYLPQVKGEESYINIVNYKDLQEIALKCNLCVLRKTCKQVVFGAGNIKSKLMLIGEGPGQDEDEQGRPFVGRAGQLLDKILAASEIPREDIYLTNVIKCLPPGNRLPNPDEVQVCQNYLEAQIRLIKPRIVVCLGNLATRTVIDKQASIFKARGRWLMRHDVKIMPTLHPAALLRNEEYKRPMWEDFKLIRDEFKKL